MIAAGKGLCIAAIRPTNSHTSVGTLIQKDPQTLILLTNQNDWVLPHICRQKISWLGHMGFVPQQDPGSTKHPLLLQPVEILIRVDTRVERAILFIQKSEDILIGPRGSLLKLPGIRTNIQSGFCFFYSHFSSTFSKQQNCPLNLDRAIYSAPGPFTNRPLFSMNSNEAQI